MTGKGTLGRRGEDIALEWLLERGLVLRERNWRWNHKEVDLIMESADWLHIIEVKSLQEPLQLEPFEHVDHRKQLNLSSAANHYVFEFHVSKEVHFDVVSIVFDREGNHRLEYIPEAFYPIYSGR